MRGIIGGGSCCADGTGFFVSSSHKRMFIGAFFKNVFMLSKVPLVYAGVADHAPPMLILSMKTLIVLGQFY